jgi:hypothetical protein
MKLQKIEDRLPLVAALVVLIGVTGAAGDALANEFAPATPASAELEISLDDTSSVPVAGF